MPSLPELVVSAVEGDEARKEGGGVKKKTIHLVPYFNIRAEFKKDEFVVEIDGYRGNNYESEYTIIFHGWHKFGHCLAEACYKAVKERVKQVLDWKEDFKKRIQDES